MALSFLAVAAAAAVAAAVAVAALPVRKSAVTQLEIAAEAEEVGEVLSGRRQRLDATAADLPVVGADDAAVLGEGS